MKEPLVIRACVLPRRDSTPPLAVTSGASSSPKRRPVRGWGEEAVRVEAPPLEPLPPLLLPLLPPGRTLLITSHSMEEVDLLSSRVAVIHAGRLQAVGPQQRLKAAFGDGYKLTCTLDTAGGGGAGQPQTPAAAAARLDAFLRRYVSPRALVTQRTDRAVGYLLPPAAVPGGPPLDVAHVFSLLLQHRAAAGLAEFGLSQVGGPRWALAAEVRPLVVRLRVPR